VFHDDRLKDNTFAAKVWRSGELTNVCALTRIQIGREGWRLWGES
jgi:hypothetical protein